MNKKTVALLLSTTITFNTFQMAMAKSVTVDSIDTSALSAILAESDVKSLDDLKQTLQDVQALSKQLNQLLTKKEDDKFLDITNKLQGALALLSTSMSYLHLSKNDATTWRLAIATGSTIINVAIRHYNKGKNISSQQVNEIVSEATQKILADNKDMSAGMREAVLSLNKISLDLNESRQMADRIIDKSASAQDYIALGSAVYLALHLITPKLTRQTDGIIKKYLPMVKSATEKGITATKSTATGATGLSSATDFLGLALSLGSPEAREVVGTTLAKLNGTVINLQSEISKMDRKLKEIK